MNLLDEAEEEANTGEMLISQTLDLWDSRERERSYKWPPHLDLGDFIVLHAVKS